MTTHSKKNGDDPMTEKKSYVRSTQVFLVFIVLLGDAWSNMVTTAISLQIGSKVGKLREFFQMLKLQNFNKCKSFIPEFYLGFWLMLADFLHTESSWLVTHNIGPDMLRFGLTTYIKRFKS